MHLTIGAFGATEFVKKLAKAGTINDIAIHNHASSEGVLTYACAASDKVQTLLQVVGMSDFPVIWLSSLTAAIGEQMVALDAAGFTQGIIVSDGVPEEQIRSITKGSALESFRVMSNDINGLRQAILETRLSTNVESQLWIPVDNYFEVKGVGTVVLGLVKKGRMKKYDTLRIEPLGKEVMVKGIQSQDKDVLETEAHMRVGLNIKGAVAAELKRGYVMCRESKVSKEITATFSKSRYAKEAVEKGSQLFIAAGLQVVVASVKGVQDGKLILQLEQPIAYQAGQRCIFASTKQVPQRIIGSGALE